MAKPVFNAIEDFVFDATFRDWVLQHHSGHHTFWENWMAENPDKIAVMNHAKSIVYALSANHNRLTEEEIDEEIRNILFKVKTARYPEELASPESEKIAPARRHITSRWLTAMAAATLIIFAVVYTRQFTGKAIQQGSYHIPDNTFRSPASNETVNSSDSVLVIVLPDQSRVQLSAKSTLVYTAASFRNKREVHLTGEAFFDVQKMPSLPFMVYTGNMVTKVLGTSFRVREFQADKKASVWVKTGKVSVYRHQSFSAPDANSKQLDGVIVIPNQQVIYDLATKQLTKNIIDKPVLLAKTADDRFVFRSTPLKQVFAVLETAYGIPVMYDESMISSCSLSVSMGNETFYEKLALICRTIDATYESIDGSIFITSHGCK